MEIGVTEALSAKATLNAGQRLMLERLQGYDLSFVIDKLISDRRIAKVKTS